MGKVTEHQKGLIHSIFMMELAAETPAELEINNTRTFIRKYGTSEMLWQYDQVVAEYGHDSVAATRAVLFVREYAGLNQIRDLQ